MGSGSSKKTEDENKAEKRTSDGGETSQQDAQPRENKENRKPSHTGKTDQINDSDVNLEKLLSIAKKAKATRMAKERFLRAKAAAAVRKAHAKVKQAKEEKKKNVSIAITITITFKISFK